MLSVSNIIFIINLCLFRCGLDTLLHKLYNNKPDQPKEVFYNPHIEDDNIKAKVPIENLNSIQNNPSLHSQDVEFDSPEPKVNENISLLSMNPNPSLEESEFSNKSLDPWQSYPLFNFRNLRHKSSRKMRRQWGFQPRNDL